MVWRGGRSSSQELIVLFFFDTVASCLNGDWIVLFPRDACHSESAPGRLERSSTRSGTFGFYFPTTLLDGVKRPVRLGALGIGNGI